MKTTTATATKDEMHELLRKRRSSRAFSNTPVEPEKLASLFEAARWAASSYNEQPWRYIYATQNQPEDFERLLGCLNAPNQLWARNAFVLILSVAKRTLSLNGKPNKFYMHDTGAANASMAYQAVALGLNLHQMGGYNADKAREALALPEDYDPVAMIAVGYPGSPDNLPEDIRQKETAPRTRRPVEQLVFEGKWQTA
jgi:nitroreductase